MQASPKNSVLCATVKRTVCQVLFRSYGSPVFTVPFHSIFTVPFRVYSPIKYLLHYAETMVFSTYTKQCILYFYSQGLKTLAITKRLLEESISCSRVGVAGFLARYESTAMINRCPGSGCPSVITDETKELVKAQMLRNDETTAFQLHRYLMDRGQPS